MLKEVKEDFGAFTSELELVVAGSNEGSPDFDLLVLSEDVSGFRYMLGQGGGGGVSLNILLEGLEAKGEGFFYGSRVLGFLLANGLEYFLPGGDIPCPPESAGLGRLRLKVKEPNHLKGT